MKSKRHHFTPLDALAAVALVGALCLLLVPVPGWIVTPLTKPVLDGGHFPFFIVLTLCCHRLMMIFSPRVRLRDTASVAVAIAVLSELAQPLFDRTPSVVDLANNLLGTAASLSAIAAYRSKQFHHMAVTLVVAAIGFAYAAQPTIAKHKATALQKSQFPILGDFESDLELALWHPQGDAKPGSPRTHLSREKKHATSGNHSLKIETNTGQFAGIHLTASQSNLDVSKHSAIEFDTFNPGIPFKLGLRMDLHAPGLNSMRLNLEFTVQTGAQHHVASLPAPFSQNEGLPQENHQLYLEKLVLHTGESQESRSFFVDQLQLK